MLSYRLEMENANVSRHSGVFLEHADLYNEIVQNTPWQQEHITVYGNTHKLPRLTAMYGDEGTSYSYSGIQTTVIPWSPAMIRVKNVVAEYDDAPFNLALVQLYRDGNDSIGWHSDDETDLVDSTIASVSMGAARVFKFRRKDDHSKKLDITLSNELIVMRGATQQYWQHCVPKSNAPCGQRLNITFRVMRG